MQYEFLKAFPKRMKNVGLYALLFLNSSQKAIWKQYGFDELADQLNMIFAVLLYVMEQSLKEEPCTIDDISAFIDSINSHYFHKSMTYEDCHELGDYIINNILSNEGKPMFFRGYDFENISWQPLHISYVANRIVYFDQDVRRTSYYLTDDGYSLLLGTLEVESNMKLTIQEMIFKMHLERQSYDKALDDIKNVFNLMRIQLQKIQEAMSRIRRNVLDYNVADYEKLLHEDLDTITQTRDKFKGYRENVQARVRELETAQIDARTLASDEEEKLKNLREIEIYLGRAIDEHQKILNRHFDLKSLYTDELEKISEMSLVRRFNLRTDLFDKILENPDSLYHIDAFLHPLFNRDIDRILNLNKVFEVQKAAAADEDEDSTEEVDFDEEAWKEEQDRLKKGEPVHEFLGKRLTTRELYNAVVGIGNVRIQLYKIEAQRELQISWSEVARNSGGEGFLSAFIILSSLLYYMRRDDTDIFADKNEGKVLLMDNPFALTNASHLLKPMMEVAKKNNTQLICLTGLGGESIYNRFDNIYVLNLVESALNRAQYLRGKHLSGKEPEVISMARIEVSSEEGQLSLVF